MKKFLILLFIFVGVIVGYLLLASDNSDIPPPDMSKISSEDGLVADRVESLDDTQTIKITLKDVTGGDSFGDATILRKDNKLVHRVSANLPVPKEGFVYEGWLVRKTPSLAFFSTGVMKLQEEGSTRSYVLLFEADETFDEYNEVVITLESKVDEIPELHVLEGSF
jgi:hypothetical protein